MVVCPFAICLTWGCPWTKNLSNLVPAGSRLCRMYISETAERIWSYLEFSWLVVVHRYSHLPIRPISACPWTRTHISETAGGISSVWNSMELSRFVVVQQASCVICQFDTYGPWIRTCPVLPIQLIWACPSARMSNSETIEWIFFHSKFYGIVQTCNYAPSCVFAHLTVQEILFFFFTNHVGLWFSIITSPHSFPPAIQINVPKLNDSHHAWGKDKRWRHSAVLAKMWEAL